MATMVSANSTPIFGSYPGWTEGKDQANIQIELFEDYLCGDCMRFNPIWEAVLATEWMDGTVSDYIKVGTTPYPLGYHVHSYQVAQMVPYFMNFCESADVCTISAAYKDFCFENVDTILGMTTTSQDDFVTYWTAEVAMKLGLD